MGSKIEYEGFRLVSLNPLEEYAYYERFKEVLTLNPDYSIVPKSKQFINAAFRRIYIVAFVLIIAYFVLPEKFNIIPVFFSFFIGTQFILSAQSWLKYDEKKTLYFKQLKEDIIASENAYDFLSLRKKRVW